MKEFHTESLADQVFQRLENDIIRGVYSRGEILTELLTNRYFFQFVYSTK